MKIVVYILLAIFISACSTLQQFKDWSNRPSKSISAYEQKVQSYLNEDVDLLLTKWGAPTRTFQKPNGDSIYEYIEVKGSTVTNYQNIGNQRLHTCITRFVVTNSNMIKDYDFEGSSCK